jgi:uncharacterized protein YkwD
MLVVGLLAITVCGGLAAQAQAQWRSAHAVAHKAKHRVSHRRSTRPSAPKVTAQPPRITAAVPAICPNAELTPTPADIAAVDQAVVCLVNKEREGRRLKALTENPSLDRAAADHTSDMIAGNYFGHVSPTGVTFAQRLLGAGYVRPGSPYGLGENVGLGTSSAAGPAEIVAAWMNEPAHRANILDAGFRETGVAVLPAVPGLYASGQPGATYTEEFGFVG